MTRHRIIFLILDQSDETQQTGRLLTSLIDVSQQTGRTMSSPDKSDVSQQTGRTMSSPDKFNVTQHLLLISLIRLYCCLQLNELVNGNEMKAVGKEILEKRGKTQVKLIQELPVELRKPECLEMVVAKLAKTSVIVKSMLNKGGYFS